jgi:ABC-type multidrug transport system fused ATPase/permease subunit
LCNLVKSYSKTWCKISETTIFRTSFIRFHLMHKILYSVLRPGHPSLFSRLLNIKDLSFFRGSPIWSRTQLVSSMPNCSSKLLTESETSINIVLPFSHSNITKFSSGIGFELGLVITLLFSAGGSVVVALIVHWQLTLLMICVVPVLLLTTNLFSKVYHTNFHWLDSHDFWQLTASATMAELDTYSKAGQIVQEVFSSIRTVLSLNGGQFEQKR